MKSLIPQALILASLLVTSASAACQTTKVRKTLTWRYFVTSGPHGGPPPALNYRNLTSPGRGYAWREGAGPPTFGYDVSRPILLENEQNWKIVNCSSYFSYGDAGQQGCTSPDLALLASPGGGKIGTLEPKGVWAVYQLEEFRITPVGVAVGDVDGEVQGWKEGGGTVKMQFHIKGVQPGYRVKVTGRWDSIVQWQVKLRCAGSRAEIGFVIDDVVIVEDAISPTQDITCTYPTQTPTTPPEPIRTLKFDDLPTGPVPTAPYKGYSLLPPYSISKSPDAVSPPNVLSASPNISSPNRFLSKSFLFDIVSFHLKISSSLPPADLSITLQGYGPCFNIFSGGGLVGGTFKYFNPPSLAFTVNTTAWGFDKHRALDLRVEETESRNEVPFEIDNLVVRSWGEGPAKGGLGLPGCARCGKYLAFFCEYPAMSRRIL